MQEHLVGIESALTAHEVGAGSTGEPLAASPAPKRVELYHPRLQSYLERLVPPRPSVLQVMEAHAKATNFPIVGPVVGQFFYVLTRMVGARRVFEL
ncbi:MAG: hypothetical protein RMK45_09535, partial [Armatimonadota bacterium]|nr:hypothetical protein [Armatimonadota bacterium]